MRRKPKSRVPRAKAIWIKLLKKYKLVTDEELMSRKKLDAEWVRDNLEKALKADPGNNFYPPRSGPLQQ